MKVLLILKGRLSEIPPTIYNIHSLLTLGHKVNVITDFEGVDKNIFGKNCINIKETIIEYKKMKNKFKKILSWFQYKTKLEKLIEKEDYDLMWIGSADTACAIRFNKIKKPFILQINELYDDHWIYKKYLKKYFLEAYRVVVPEENRAHICRSWYGLKNTPIVMPNIIPEDMAPEEKNRERRKTVIYQGKIYRERDIRPFVKVIKERYPEWQFVVMGQDYEFIKEIKKVNSEIKYIKNINPPLHLEETMKASVGIIYYDYSNMNNVFCAPNKLWEYARYGIPVICNDMPGIETYIKQWNCGISVKNMEEEEIYEAMAKITSQYSYYSGNARAMYRSVNRLEIMESIIS